MNKWIVYFGSAFLLCNVVHVSAIPQKRPIFESAAAAGGMAILSAALNKIFCDSKAGTRAGECTPPSIPMVVAEVLLTAAASYGVYCWRWHETPIGREADAAKVQEGIEISGIFNTRTVEDARTFCASEDDPLLAAYEQVGVYVQTLHTQQNVLQEAIQEADDEEVRVRCVARRDKAVESMNFLKSLQSIIGTAWTCEKTEHARLPRVEPYLEQAQVAYNAEDKPLISARQRFMSYLIELDRQRQGLDQCKFWGVSKALVPEWERVSGVALGVYTRLSDVKLAIDGSPVYAREKEQLAREKELEIKDRESQSALERAQAARANEENRGIALRVAERQSEIERTQKNIELERAEAERIAAPARAQAEMDRARALAEREERNRLEAQRAADVAEAERLRAQARLIAEQRAAAARARHQASPEDAPPAYTKAPSAPPEDDLSENPPPIYQDIDRYEKKG